MAQVQVIEGTRKEIQDHLNTLDSNLRLTLIVQADGEPSEAPKNLYYATPDERARALDEIAEMNKGVPVLPAEAFNREALYEETP
jgi:hypothetical protein